MIQNSRKKFIILKIYNQNLSKTYNLNGKMKMNLNKIVTLFKIANRI